MNLYESSFILSQYLLFHYGSGNEQMPFDLGTLNSLDFPVRCVSECLDKKILPKHATALDLGCAVGRSCFELAKYCDHVLGIDSSRAFIDTAKKIQQKKEMPYIIKEEGTHYSEHVAKLPEDANADRVEFRCQDVLDLIDEIDQYDVVLAANLLCRLKTPRALLSLFPQLVKPGGQLILISPYSWLDQYTPRGNWLSKADVRAILEKDFTLVKSFDMPFVLREHLRKYQWVVADAATWIRKS